MIVMGRGSGTYNPYTPDAGARPPALTGRDAEFEHLRSIIGQLGAGGTEKHVLVTGLRGVGKTVLLNEFERMCEEAGWPAETKEVGRNSLVATLVGRVARRALLQMSARKRVGDRIRRAMSVLSSFELTLPGDVSFKLDVAPAVGQADSGDLADDLRDVLVAVGQAAAQSDTGFALILDEAQNLSRDDYEALIMALHRVKQKNLPVAFVGAGLPLMPMLGTEAKTYAERMFIYASIGALSFDAAREALVQPAQAQAVGWEHGAVDHVFRYTEGYPYFLQEYGRCAWAQGFGSTITLADVQAAESLVTDYLDGNFFEPRIGRLTDAARAYVSALAALGDAPQQTSAIAERLGRGAKSLSPVRDELIGAAIIYAPKYGYVDFTVPHCGSFARRRYPLGPDLATLLP
jgi:AAA ATPase domain